MNILTVSTIDNRGGGSKIPWNLMLGLRERGHDTSMFVGWKFSDDPTVHVIPKNRLYYRLSKFFADDLRFSRSDGILKTEEYKKADIIHFHNIHSGFFNWSTFAKIVKEKKSVWTTHDLWPITSSCTTTIGCRTEGPMRMFGFLWDNRPRLLEEKKKVYGHSRFHVAAPSHWIDKKIAGSIMKDMPRRVILNGIDTDIFKPYPKADARKGLNLPQDKRIILFVANGGLKNKYKGGDIVTAIASEWKKRKDIVFVIIGNKDITPKVTQKDGNIILIGNIEDENILAQYYSAADVLIYPTRADNCPLVVLESMACGTPVVTFATDGVPEIISNLGYIAKSEDTADISRGTKQLLSMSKTDLETLGNKCVERIRTHYSLKRMVDEYEALYRDIIQEI